MILFWGKAKRDKILYKGKFFCPRCRTDTEYLQMEVSQWFIIYFIPVSRLADLGQQTVCKSCGIRFRPDVANLSREQLLEISITWFCDSCGSENQPSATVCAKCRAKRRDLPTEPPPLPQKSRPRASREDSRSSKYDY